MRRNWRSALILTFLFFTLTPQSELAAQNPPAVSAVSERNVQNKNTAQSSTPLSKEKILFKSAGSLQIPDDEYAQSMIQKYITQYTSTFGKRQLAEILDRGEQYRLYIRRELAERKMPGILEYLPVVESDYNPKAVSRSGATGLWQFMENSIYPFLKKNEWIDERLDPWKSTDAALSKLQDNYNQFGDWLIAIAAYNCGAGAMTRILKNAEEKTFWFIAENALLRDQSVQYVPKLFAICILAENSHKFDITLPDETKSPYFADFDFVTTNFSVPLQFLATEIRVPSEILEELNLSLIKKCTPPDAQYKVRLPLGTAHAAQTALARVNPDHL